MNQPVERERTFGRRASADGPQRRDRRPCSGCGRRRPCVGLATVPPGDPDAEPDVQSAEAGDHQSRWSTLAGATSATVPRTMNAAPITGRLRTEYVPALTTAAP